MSKDSVHTNANDATRAVENRDATRKRDAGLGPTPEEEAAAERGKSELTPEGAENYEEYLKKAAKLRGEGRIP